MAFSDISSKTDTLRIGAFAILNVYNRNTDSSTTLYWSDAGITTDKVDGTVRTWDARIVKWRVTKPDQKIGTSRWAFPTATIDVWLGDSDDSLWDYLTVNHEWEGQEFNFYLVDLEQTYTSSTVNGVRRQIKGVIQGGPKKLGRGIAFSITAAGPLYNVQLPNTRLDIPSRNFSGFIQPAAYDNVGDTLNGAINATATSVTLTAGGAQWSDRRVIVVGNEAMLITSDAGDPTFTVVRGYGGTTAASHANGATANLYKNGVNQACAKSGGQDEVLPFVFGPSNANIGIYLPVWPQGYAGAAGGWDAGSLEMWVARGKLNDVSQAWLSTGGVIDYRSSPAWYNDLDSQLNSPAHPHRNPNIQIAGTYLGDFDDGDCAGGAWSPDSDYVWVRCAGVDNSGVVLRWPTSVMWYLLVNSDWALGLTLNDYVYADRIDPTDWAGGDWGDEYSEDYFTKIVGVVPYPGGNAPMICDTLQGLCDLVNSDLFIRDGLFYPKRRWAASSADASIGPEDLTAPLVELRDPQGIYCNRLKAECGQSVLSQPNQIIDHDPVDVPYVTTLQDGDEIVAHNDTVVDAEVSRPFFRFDFSAQWSIGDSSIDYNGHLTYWRQAHQDMLDQRAQPQIWFEAQLPGHFAWLEQGDTIEFDVTPHITRNGQIREVRLEGGQGQPIRVTTKSWHASLS